jgi:hypothetical protein
VSVTSQALKAAGAVVTTGASVATGAGASVAAGAGASVGVAAGAQAAISIENTIIIDIKLKSSLLFMVSFLLRKFIRWYD